jgi:hypothetical protein
MAFSGFQQGKYQGQAQYDFTRIGHGPFETNYKSYQCNLDDGKVFLMQKGIGNSLRQPDVAGSNGTLVKRLKISES